MVWSQYAVMAIIMFAHKRALQDRLRWKNTSITSQFQINKCIQVDIFQTAAERHVSMFCLIFLI